MASPKPTPVASTAALPAQIEIFRAGRHTDDTGTVHNFSAADVAGMCNAYDPALREAPLTIGHPAHNLPAYGWVKGLQINAAGNLAMHTHQVAPQFAEMVGNKAFKKRSASFYPPGHASNPKPGNWYLRHVAFLGAQPPAIAGLADFADLGAVGAVSFSEGDDPEPPVPIPDTTATVPATPTLTATPLEQLRMTQALQDQLAAAAAKQAQTDAALAKAISDTAAANAQLAQFAESARRDRTTGYASFADAQIAAGRLLPKDKEAAVAVLGTLADSAPVSFSEGGATKTVAPAEWLKGLIAAAKPLVSFSEQANGTVTTTGQGQGKSDAEIDALAQAYARQHKVNYAEALSAVVTFTA